MVGTLVAILNNVSLNIALPVIMRDIQVERYSTIQWLTTINMLVSGVLIPTSAYFVTKFKSHQVFITAMSIFTAGTMLAIFVPNFPLLLLARAIQAAGTAILMPLLMNVLLATVSREKRGMALGINGLIYMMAPVIGPLLSGFIVDRFGWRMIFVMIALLAIIALALAVWKLENVLEQRETSIDFFSVVLSSVSFTSILLGFGNASVHGWTDITVYGVILVGLLALVFFVIRQCKIEKPLLDLSVYKYSMFALSSVIAIILALILYAPMMLMPIYLQNIQGYTTFQSGLISLPGTLVMALAMPFTGWLYDKVGARPLAIIGFSMIGVASYFLSLLSLETAATNIMIWLIVRGLGVALVMSPVQTNGLNQLPNHLNPSGTAVNGTIQQVSGAIGTAIFVTLKTHYSEARTTELMNEVQLQLGSPLSDAVQDEIARQAGVDAINFTFLIGVVLTVLAIILSIFIKKPVYHEEKAVVVDIENVG